MEVTDHTEKFLKRCYRQYLIDKHTVAEFAADNDWSVDFAQSVIDVGKSLHESSIGLNHTPLPDLLVKPS